jgi:hypothetical protein
MTMCLRICDSISDNSTQNVCKGTRASLGEIREASIAMWSGYAPGKVRWGFNKNDWGKGDMKHIKMLLVSDVSWITCYRAEYKCSLAQG